MSGARCPVPGSRFHTKSIFESYHFIFNPLSRIGVNLNYSLSRYQQGGSCTPQGGPPSYPRTQESLTVPSVGSPPSAAPSPLPNPHSQPASEAAAGEQPMPTLSPHPPAQLPIHSPGEGGRAPTPSEPGPESQESQQPSPSNPPPPDTCRTSMQEHPHANTHTTNAGLTLKRPVLTSKEYENALLEEEQTLDLLYDYSTLEAW